MHQGPRFRSAIAAHWALACALPPRMNVDIATTSAFDTRRIDRASSRARAVGDDEPVADLGGSASRSSPSASPRVLVHRGDIASAASEGRPFRRGTRWRRWCWCRWRRTPRGPPSRGVRGRGRGVDRARLQPSGPRRAPRDRCARGVAPRRRHRRGGELALAVTSRAPRCRRTVERARPRSCRARASPIAKADRARRGAGARGCAPA